MNFLEGIIDMHLHTNPDLRKRRYDDLELTDIAVKNKARAIVIKTHQGLTVDRAYLCNKYRDKLYPDSNFSMFGSITLNNQVGGINPYAVESALKLGAKVVWMPTSSAKNHREKLGSDTKNSIEILEDKNTINNLKSVLQLIKDFDVVLASAHLSVYEIFKLTELAKDMGIRKIVITHPEWWVVDMSLNDQKRIVSDYDVFLERCYASNMGNAIYKSNLPSNLEAIKEIGSKNIIISTDGGQIENPSWEIAINEYANYMYENGISYEDIITMTQKNQEYLLGLGG